MDTVVYDAIDDLSIDVDSIENIVTNNGNKLKTFSSQMSDIWFNIVGATPDGATYAYSDVTTYDKGSVPSGGAEKPTQNLVTLCDVTGSGILYAVIIRCILNWLHLGNTYIKMTIDGKVTELTGIDFESGNNTAFYASKSLVDGKIPSQGTGFPVAPSSLDGPTTTKTPTEILAGGIDVSGNLMTVLPVVFSSGLKIEVGLSIDADDNLSTAGACACYKLMG